MPSYADEFPLLALFGLYASEIRGDGNCLFNALSDQLYGTQDHHAAIRTQVIEYMRDQAAYYKQFLEVYPGGGTRRNPKRKNAGTYTSTHAQAPSPADVDRVFEEHIARMSRGGTWGDNMELQAFAAAYDSNVKIYQRDFTYIIPAPSGADRPFQHIAYHTWEHYSSIRNIDGPHAGLPHVNPKPLSPASEEEHQRQINATKPQESWKVEQLSNICRGIDRASVLRALEECRGSIDQAYERLMTSDEHYSVSSQQSSSVEREPDSGDESGVGPNKRQDRRLSRASRPSHKSKPQSRYRQVFANHEMYRDSLESLVNATSGLPDSKPTAKTTLSEDDGTDEESDEDDEDDETSQDWKPPALKDGDTSSGSEYGSSPPTNKPDNKIKLSVSQGHSQASTKASAKPPSPGKKILTAREKKSVKKQAQKQAARERKQLAMGGRKSSLSSVVSASASNSLHPTSATTAMRTLYI